MTTHPTDKTAEHTPPPWRVDDDDYRFLSVIGQNQIVCDTHPDEILGGCVDEQTIEGVAKANAAFIVEVVNNYDRLKAENKRLLNALNLPVPTPLPLFLGWIARRLVRVYGENEDTDFVLALKEHAKRIRAALNTEEG